MIKRIACLFLILTFPVISTSAVKAQSASEVDLKLISSDAESVEVGISWELDEDAPGYDLTIQYSGPIDFSNFTVSSTDCPAEVVSSFANQVSLFCLMSPGQNLESRTNVGNLMFDVTGEGSVRIEVLEADFGGMEVDRDSIELVVSGGDPEAGGYLFENFTLLDVIWLLGGLCLLALLALSYLYLTNKRISSRTEQFMMLGLVGFAVITGTGAMVLSMGDDFDTRDKAADQICVRDCGTRQCGDDGCGGSCGECGEGEDCSGDGVCYVREPGTPPVSEEMFACEVDTDCMTASSTCCLCNEGGREMAINKNYWEEYKDKILHCEPDILCPQVFLCSGAEAICVNKVCTLGGEDPPPPPPDPGPRDELIGDINDDGSVNLADYAIFLSDFIDWKYERKMNSRSDLNRDQKISIADYVIFVDSYLEHRQNRTEADSLTTR